MGNLLDLFVFKYNRTDFHELNLDWIISDVQVLAQTLENFININTIKYADPIQWSIDSQYEANTVVIDEATSTAYLSTHPVPVGVAITNPDYWTPIFSLNIGQTNNNITLRDDGNNTLSTFTSVIGDWIIWNGTLYKVILDIGLSQAYLPGYNIERYTVELFIRDYITELTNTIGSLNDLTTIDKTNLVNAINEIVGNVTSVTNTANATALKLNNLDIINVKDYGAVGDGVNDDTQSIKDAIVAAQASITCKLVFFPSGVYRITDTLTIGYAGDKKLSAVSIAGEGEYNTQILCDGDFDAIVYEGDETVPNYDGYLYGFYIRDLYIHYAGNDSTKTGLTIRYAGIATVENVRIRYFKTAVYLSECGNSVFDHIGISANVAGAVGFDVGDRSVSNYYNACFFAASGNASGLTADSIGFKLARGTIADQNINYFDVGGSATTAIFINGANQLSGQQHGDINITDLVCESWYGIQAYNIDVHPNINIIGGWFNCTGERQCIALSNASGVMIRDAVFVFNSAVLYDNKGAIVFRDANCNNITVMGCLCRNQYLLNGGAGGNNILVSNNQVIIDAPLQQSSVAVNGKRCVITGNIFRGAPIRYVRLFANATNSLVTNNVGSGEATGTAFDNGAGATSILDNNIA